MGQHGFARDMSFTMVEKGSDYAAHEPCANEETKKQVSLLHLYCRVIHQWKKKITRGFPGKWKTREQRQCILKSAEHKVCPYRRWNI